jgi:hypothetical protein
MAWFSRLKKCNSDFKRYSVYISFDISFSELLLHCMTFSNFWKKKLRMSAIWLIRDVFLLQILLLPSTGNDRSFFPVSFGWDLRDSQACVFFLFDLQLEKINLLIRLGTLPLKGELLAKARTSLSSESKYIPVNGFSCFGLEKWQIPCNTEWVQHIFYTVWIVFIHLTT